MVDICGPALVYIFFTLAQLFIDFYQDKYNEFFQKIISGGLITALLILLCKKNFTTIAWVIVLVPFLLMALIMGILVFILGYDVSTGTLTNSCNSILLGTNTSNITYDSSGNILIYNPNYNKSINPVYYNSPYIVVPMNNNNNKLNSNSNLFINPTDSSSPMYIS